MDQSGGEDSDLGDEGQPGQQQAEPSKTAKAADAGAAGEGSGAEGETPPASPPKHDAAVVEPPAVVAGVVEEAISAASDTQRPREVGDAERAGVEGEGAASAAPSEAVPDKRGDRAGGAEGISPASALRPRQAQAKRRASPVARPNIQDETIEARLREIRERMSGPARRRPAQGSERRSREASSREMMTAALPPPVSLPSDGPRRRESLERIERIREEQRDIINEYRAGQEHLPLEIEEAPARRRPKQASDTREELLSRLLDPTLTLQETAILLGVCPTTVRRYTNKGVLSHYRTPGNQRRFKLSDVLAFMERQGPM